MYDDLDKVLRVRWRGGEEVPGKAGMALSACERRRVWCGSSQVDEGEIRFESRSLASWTRLFDGEAARCGLTGDSSSIVNPGVTRGSLRPGPTVFWNCNGEATRFLTSNCKGIRGVAIQIWHMDWSVSKPKLRQPTAHRT